MTRPIVTITHEDINGGNPVRVYCRSIAVSGSKNNSQRPTPGRFDKNTVQTVSVENLRFALRGLRIRDDGFQWSHWRTLYLSKFDGSNPATLNISYGDNKKLTGITGDENIKVILDSGVDLTLDTGESKDAYLPFGSLIFVETRTG